MKTHDIPLLSGKKRDSSKKRDRKVGSTIEVTDNMTVVAGVGRDGKPFAVRIGAPTAAFADACDQVRVHPRKPGDLILCDMKNYIEM